MPELQPLEDAMQAYLTARKFDAGALALMKDSRLVLRQGYGWRDNTRTETARPDPFFRLTGLTKAITASAIQKLIYEGKITASTKFHAYLGITPWRGSLGDSRINDITIQMLLDHKGGWDSTVSAMGDPVLRTVSISQEMGLDHPASATEAISYALSRPLDFIPGARAANSNLGYQILGRIVEKAAGKPFLKFVQEDLLGPFAVPAVATRSRPADRDPREIWYADSEPWVRTAVGFPAADLVPLVDGGYYFESMDSSAGLAMTAEGVCRFMTVYLLGYTRRDLFSSGSFNQTFQGGLNVGSTVARQQIVQSGGAITGLEFAAFFNNHTKGSQTDETQARSAIETASGLVSSWPVTGGGTIRWATNSTEVSRKAGTVTVLLQRSGGSTTAAKVSYATSPVSADTRDFFPASGVIEFAPGETVKPVTVRIVDNARSESVREFSLELISVAGGASLGDRLSSTVRILNPAASEALKVANLATRVFVGAGEGVLITGIVLGGEGSRSYLVRGVGPTLEAFGVSGALARPVLTVFDQKGRILASNTGWDPALRGTFSAVGAFNLTAGSTDAALVISLSAGAYTIQIAGAGGSTGVALAEVYELP